ncbi:MAG: hypothetical protein ABEH58_00155 [Haloplanus sp.]
MPSPNPPAVLAGLATAVVLVVAIATQQVLLGVFIAGVVYLVGWLIARISAGTPFDHMTRERKLATGGLVALVLGYAVVIATRLLLGVVVAGTVVVVSWLTDPRGPVAAWLDEAR